MNTDDTASQQTPRINLIGTPKAAGAPRLAAPNEGMSMERLQQNYWNILHARAIYYPVAYQFLHRLGRGRQGIVFLGLRQGARGCITEHAIKVFDPHIYRSPEEYWTDMGRIASQVSHLQRVQSPNLVTRYSYEETYGIGYVQMEAIDGLDLVRFLAPENVELARSRSTDEEWHTFADKIFRTEGEQLCLQPGIVVYILRSVLRGIERLHASHFLHADIKPGNIMIDRLGYVRIVDFGRAVTFGEKLTFLLGSPMYMSPEMHRGEPAGPRSDFFSLGIVGLEMLRGEPFVPPELVPEDDAVLQIKEGLQNSLHSLLPDYVLENVILVSILRRFLEPDPQKGYATAKEAEAGDEGLVVVDKQFARAGFETEYARLLSDYVSKFIDPRTDRVELPLAASEDPFGEPDSGPVS